MSNNIDPLPRRAFSTDEVAVQLGINKRRVLTLIHNDKLRARHTGNAYIIPASAIDEYLDGRDDPMKSAS